MMFVPRLVAKLDSRPSAESIGPTLKLVRRGLRVALRLAAKQPLGVVSATVVVLVFLVAALAPVLARYDYTAIGVGPQLTAPGAKFWFGTDNFGRDVFTRVLWGTRYSLYVAFGSIAIGAICGTLLGLTAGYIGGTLDDIVQRVMDALLAIPLMFMAMVIVFALQPSLENLALAIGSVLVPRINRVVRAVTLAAKEEPFVEAARCIGCSTARILRAHILPQCYAPLMVSATGYLAYTIVVESSISFVGLGAKEPTPTWGGILAVGIQSYIQTAPWLILGPGAALGITVLAFNLLGDALRDELDPRLRGSTGQPRLER